MTAQDLKIEETTKALRAISKEIRDSREEALAIISAAQRAILGLKAQLKDKEMELERSLELDGYNRRAVVLMAKVSDLEGSVSALQEFVEQVRLRALQHCDRLVAKSEYLLLDSRFHS